MKRKMNFEGGMIVETIEGNPELPTQKDLPNEIYIFIDRFHSRLKHTFHITKIPGKNLLSIELPVANSEWTFEVWRFIQEFVKAFPGSYPRHKPDDGCHIYIEYR